jgi:hypothetical protein
MVLGSVHSFLKFVVGLDFGSTCCLVSVLLLQERAKGGAK